MINSKKISLLAILTILTFSIITPSIAYAAPLATSDKDWQYMNGNSWAWNYSPQTQINKDSVQRLEVKWILPVPGSATGPAQLRALNPSEGISAPLLIHNGKGVGTTNVLKTIQYDLKTGKVLWTNDYTVNITEAEQRLPVIAPRFALHLHGLRYWEAGNAVLNSGLVCDFYGIDFNTGETKFRVENLCVNVPGNVNKYADMMAGGGTAEIGTWEKERQFIVGMHGTTAGAVPGGRFFYAGVSMDSKQVVWRIFAAPPQDQPDKDWALHECDKGYFVTTPCSEIAKRDRSLLEWDWQAVPGQPPHRLNGVSFAWGQSVIDEDTGILYSQTGNQSPYANLTSRPGPNLYGSTIMAIDMSKGQRIWWIQPNPHDPWDKDCYWSGMLIDHPQLGKVYVKGCKDGYMYIIDAKTGKPLQRWDAIAETYGKKFRSYIIYDPAGVIPGSPNSWEGFKEMLRLPWGGAGQMEVESWARIYKDGKLDRTAVLLSPSINDFAGEASYDGENTIYYQPNIAPYRYGTIDLEAAAARGQASWLVTRIGPDNTTLVARDLVTGKVKWTWGPVPGSHRALGTRVIITGGMAVISNVDGVLRFFDKDTGKLLHSLNIGSPMLVGPSIGKDSDGNSVILVEAGVSGSIFGLIGASTAGAVVGIGLSERPVGEVRTTTVTTTATTTISATTVTSTVSSTLTQTAEAIGPVTYGAVAVAVIAIIAAAILMTRRRSA